MVLGFSRPCLFYLARQEARVEDRGPRKNDEDSPVVAFHSRSMLPTFAVPTKRASGDDDPELNEAVFGS